MTHSIILPTIYGQIIVNRYDGNQTQYLLRTGKAIDHDEIANTVQLIEPGTDAVDIGTCFGIWTLAFSQRARKVYSFEAQRILYNQLCGTLALNGIENVFTENAVVGAKHDLIDAPKYDYNGYLEFGCVYFCPQTKQGRMAQEVQASTEKVRVVPLDAYNLSNIGLIKIDVEGMELEVLNGARKTIQDNRPILHIEIFMLDRALLTAYMDEMNYGSFDNTENMIAFPNERYSVELLEDGKRKMSKK